MLLYPPPAVAARCPSAGPVAVLYAAWSGGGFNATVATLWTSGASRGAAAPPGTLTTFRSAWPTNRHWLNLPWGRSEGRRWYANAWPADGGGDDGDDGDDGDGTAAAAVLMANFTAAVAAAHPSWGFNATRATSAGHMWQPRVGGGGAAGAPQRRIGRVPLIVPEVVASPDDAVAKWRGRLWSVLAITAAYLGVNFVAAALPRSWLSGTAVNVWSCAAFGLCCNTIMMMAWGGVCYFQSHPDLCMATPTSALALFVTGAVVTAAAVVRTVVSIVTD